MVLRTSYLRGRKDRRDYPPSYGNFLGSEERPDFADNSSSVLRRPPKHVSRPTRRTIHQWPKLHWIANFRDCAAQWNSELPLSKFCSAMAMMSRLS
jgi:hypothetical protein